MMKTLQMAGVVLAAVSVARFSGAETLAWYHFSEQKDGTKATCNENGIVDSSQREKHGKVVSVKNQTEGTDATLSPTYSSTFGCTVTDYTSETNWSNGTALDFAAIGTSSAQTGAVIRVDNFMEEGDSFGSVTVEALVCTLGGSYNVFSPIVGLWRDASSCLDEYWALMMNANGRISVRFSGSISSDSGHNYSTGTHVIKDGKWHSIALVHDAAKDVGDGKVTVRVYVDGELDATYSWTMTKRANYTNGPLYIGGYSAISGRIFNGMVDEVRVHDVALEPAQLMRAAREYPIDEDTLVYVPFDRMPGVRSSSDGNLNVVSGGPTMTLQQSSIAPKDGIPAAEFTTDCPSPRIAYGRFSKTTKASGTSLWMRKSESGNGSGVYGDSAAYMSTSFTSEIFFKGNGQQAGSSYSDSTRLFRCGPAATRSLWLTMGNYLYISYTQWDASKSAYSTINSSVGNQGEFNDNKWHHYAVVYDRNRQTMTVYVDRRLRYAAENVNLKPDDYMFFINNNPTGDNITYFDGWVDEFRFTKRALNPNEFLCQPNESEEANPDTLLRVSFENDLKVTSGWGKYEDAETVDDVSFVSSENERLAGDMIWTNNTAEGACLTNLYAARFARGYLGVKELPPYEGKDLTIEMFVKLKAWDSTANLFRVLYGDNPGYGDDPICALYPASDTKSSLTTLNARIAFSTNCFAGPVINSSDTGVIWTTFSLPEGKNLADGRWHHLAMVFETGLNDKGEERTVGKLYVDYLSGGTIGHDGHLAIRSMYSPRPRVSFGRGTSNLRLNADFDELRISAKALKPSEFLFATKFKRGMLLLFR